MKKFIPVLLAYILFSRVVADTIKVPDDYAEIQSAINAGSDYDTVLVMPGVYSENISFESRNLLLGSLYVITNDTDYIHSTIIDGGFRETVVRFENGESREAVISGFTVMNGYNHLGGGILCDYGSSPQIRNNVITECGAEYGAGIYCAADCDAVISENVIAYNHAYSRYTAAGAGIYCLHADPVIEKNTIIFNQTESERVRGVGGGIACSHSSPIIRNNIIKSNTIVGNPNNFGGGIHCDNSEVVILVNTIENNAATHGGAIALDQETRGLISFNRISGNVAENEYYFGSGGGIFCNYQSNVEIKNNLIVDNSSLAPSATGYGGGIFCMYADPLIANNVFYHNRSNIGGAISCINVANPMIVNSILWLNYDDLDNEIGVIESEPLFIYNDIRAGWQGEGNIDIDPLFRDPDNGDFHLMATYCGDPHDSPCIDMGNPDIFDIMLDCDWGLGTLRSDMGAYGGADSVPVGIEDDKHPAKPDRIALVWNYPNPFNVSSIIAYELPQPSQVRLEIFDISGRKIETLIDKYQPAGYHRVVWYPDDISSGLYLYKLQSGTQSETRKMMLLK